MVRSHHCGVLADHLRAAARAGLSAWPSPTRRRPCRQRAGGMRSSAPTGRGGFPAPRGRSAARRPEPAEVARGKVMVAAKEGKPIPPAGRLDQQGRPTTDAKAALEGSMLPIGAVSSPKGAMLALVACFCWSPR
ncbi:MAG: Ldh family oxidoreductase [Rubrivivax sp.]